MLDTNMSPWPCYTEDEISAVSQILKTGRVNYWTGRECREFEKEFALWCQSEYAIAVANGTVALDLALKALNIGTDDEVIVTSRSFIASVSCVVNAGAIPVFTDVDKDSGNINAKTIYKVITNRTKAIICVHLAGWPCEMDPIMELAKEFNLKVIEDCAQAHGARYKGRSVGSIGDVGAWSFCQDKIMTTGGEGGMVTTNNHQLWEKMWSFKDHGKSHDAVYSREHPKGFRWLHDSFGTNWRMLEMQAVIGRLQIKKMREWTVRRNFNAQMIWDACRQHSALRVPDFHCRGISCDNLCVKESGCVHACYKCYVYVRPEKLAAGWTRDRVVEELNTQGVPCYYGSCSEMYLEKCFDQTRFRPIERLPIARMLGETSLMFLVHPTLKEEELNKSCKVINVVLSQASKQ